MALARQPNPASVYLTPARPRCLQLGESNQDLSKKKSQRRPTGDVLRSRQAHMGRPTQSPFERSTQ